MRKNMKRGLQVSAGLICLMVVWFGLMGQNWPLGRATYTVDPTAADHSVTGNGQTVKGLLTTIGTSKSATLYFRHTGVGNETLYPFLSDLDASAYIKVRFEFEEGAKLAPATAKKVTLVSMAHVRATDEQHVFAGDGLVKFVYFSRVTAENFGATGDGTTNDYTVFLRALKSGCTQNNGVHISWNPQRVYVLNAGADPAIELNADSLPDGTDSTGWTDLQLPKFVLGPDDVPTGSVSGAISDSGYLLITGTGDGISMTSSGTRKWRGKIHLQNIALNGNGTAARGIFFNYFDRENSFWYLQVNNFVGDGCQFGANNTFALQIYASRAEYNGGWGWSIDGNAYDLFGCMSEGNGTGGVLVGNTSAANQVNWWGGGIQYNAIPQIKVAVAANVNFDGTYIESQHSMLYGGVEVAGLGRGIIELNSGGGSLFNVSFRNMRIQPSSTADPTKQEQFVFNVLSHVLGLTIDNIYIGDFSNAGYANYVVNDCSAYVIQKARLNGVYHAAGSVDETFENAAAEAMFQMASTKAKEYIQIKTIISDSVIFSLPNMSDNTNNQTPYIGPESNSASIEFKLPWDCSLVGMSVNSNITAGSVTISEGTVGLSETLTFASHGDGKEYRYAIGAKHINDGVSFNPLVSTSSLGGATSDVVIIFYFAIDVNEQDRDS